MPEACREPLAAQARTLARAGKWQPASDKLCQLIGEVVGIPARHLEINRDQYSLNSLNGRVTLADDRTLFFKYHHEEGEDHTIEEYYRAGLLRDHGFRVDVPLYACGEPGRQILLYQLRNDRRLADVCRDIELSGDWDGMGAVVDAQQRADAEILALTLPTLQPGQAADVVMEPIHQLFYHRLVSPGDTPGLGGRVKRFYVDQTFKLGDESLSWQTLSNLQWEINGVRYGHTLRQLFLEAAVVLAPGRLANHGVVVAHGDAHNANVWFDTHADQPQLVSFDPAFAGSHIPALLAEVKATFHNIFAHPHWLYEPAQATDCYQVSVKRRGDTLEVQHDWQLTPLRAAFLNSKGEGYWRPLLRELKARGWLPRHWQRIVRLALFCCPMLVLDLRAGGGSGHTSVSSPLGLSLAVMLGSEGDDAFNQWLQQLI
ncbi:hypothetical protein PCO85_17650 [Prodigiosinella aquatilis]|nr:hypothetical protein [Prodigiosinella sp. LS101]WJV52999.1 hypothetical protein PCO85_17650 [Prodigiosinella sp. LS101]WJV57354.1 hypothetical protein PCO84_17625 [Pectobacteriaceae bacterium C111]